MYTARTQPRTPQNTLCFYVLSLFPFELHSVPIDPQLQLIDNTLFLNTSTEVLLKSNIDHETLI